MKHIWHIIIFSLLTLVILSYGSQEDGIDYDFIQKDSCYSFQGSFFVKANPDSLISIIYDFNNMLEYTPGAQTIELIQQGDNWYDVSYTYQKFLIFENKSIWQRTLDRNLNKVVFKMISSKNNLKMMPEMVSSEGYYQITKEKELCRVEFFQECILKSGLFLRGYINAAKQESIEFLHEFKNYLENQCN
jgi:hypothetical protein